MTSDDCSGASAKFVVLLSCTSYDAVPLPGLQSIVYGWPDMASASMNNSGATGVRQMLLPSLERKPLSGARSVGHLANFVSTRQAMSALAGTLVRRRVDVVAPRNCRGPLFTVAQTSYWIAPSTGVQMKSTPFAATSRSPSAGAMRSGELVSQSGLNGMSNSPTLETVA